MEALQALAQASHVLSRDHGFAGAAWAVRRSLARWGLGYKTSKLFPSDEVLMCFPTARFDGSSSSLSYAKNIIRDSCIKINKSTSQLFLPSPDTVSAADFQIWPQSARSLNGLMLLPRSLSLTHRERRERAFMFPFHQFPLVVPIFPSTLHLFLFHGPTYIRPKLDICYK